MIELKWIEKYFKDRTKSSYELKNLNLKIDQGEFVKIVRPSGDSYSSLLYVFGILNVETSNDYFFLENPSKAMSKKSVFELFEKNIGVVFRQHNLINDLSVYDNLEAPLVWQNMGEQNRKSKISEIIKEFDLAQLKNLLPHQLTLEQTQIISLARTIICRSKILILDNSIEYIKTWDEQKIAKFISAMKGQGTSIILAENTFLLDKYVDRTVKVIENEKAKNRIIENNLVWNELLVVN